MNIKSKEDIDEGVAYLVKSCPYMKKINALCGAPPTRTRKNNFASLANIIVSQQLSVASASAIWARVEAGIVPVTPAVLLSRDEKKLRAMGLSAGKVKTLKALSSALCEKQFTLRGLQNANEDEVRDALTAVHGIGPWTATIYIMFCLGRADAFACGDLALQNAAADLMDLKSRPSASQLAKIAQSWSPWRGVAARMLWSYYNHIKQREGITG